MDIHWQTIARDLRLLADIAENACPDYMLFQGEAQFANLSYPKLQTRRLSLVWGKLAKWLSMAQESVCLFLWV